MTRYLLLLPLLALTPVAATAVVPPVPRVVIPHDAIPKPDEPEQPDDPAKVAERIAKNARDLGERLAKEDTGPETLTGQEKLKRDIESLIKALENPPPMSNQANPMDNQQGNQGQQNQPMGGGQSGSPMGGQQPKGGGQQGRQPGGNRGGQRQQQPGGQGQQPGQPMQQPGGQQPQGVQPGQQQPGQPGGDPKGGAQPGGGGVGKPALPLDEAIARDFWGNLPDLPRQRMLQFFREQYMSRYKELLPQYYQSLAEKEKMNKK